MLHFSRWKTALILFVCLIASPVLTYPLGRDQGEFATIGRGILNGRVPYTELWNPKPPAVFYIYALVMRLLGQTAMALRAIDFLVVPICSACLFWIGRRLINLELELLSAALASLKQCPHFILAKPCPRGR